MSEVVQQIRFNFEDFLDSVQDELPKGIDSSYLSLLDVVQKPWHNLRRIPEALTVLPISAYLLQSWTALIQLYIVPIILSLPLMILSIYSIIVAGTVGDAVLFMILNLIGIIVAPYYIQTMYNTFTEMIESVKAPWLSSTISKPFTDYYQRKAPKIIIIVSFLLPFILDAQVVVAVIRHAGGSFVILWYALTVLGTIIGHIGTALVIAVTLIALNFVRVNSNLYDILLKKITSRVAGYTEGHASILTSDTYEVVKVLSDTPGLSVQNLGNIPVLGLLTAILVVNSVLFMLGAPSIVIYMTSNAQQAYNAAIVAGKSSDFAKNASLDAKVAVFTGAFVIALLISVLLSTTQVLRPVIQISSSMGKFKNKALAELDPFIYDEITNVALEKKKHMEDETQLLFILRQYIYNMKISPVNPYRLAYFTLLFSIYALRLVPALVRLLG